MNATTFCLLCVYLLQLYATFAFSQLLTCVGCPQGFFYDADNHSHGHCTLCPPSMTTFAYENVTDATDCSCNVTFTNSSERCELCALGTFKNFIGNLSCVHCAANSTTLQVGSFDVHDCVCDPGFFNLEGTHSCVECERGFFKSEHGDEACLECPSNTFCPALATVTPPQCPLNSVSTPGSVRLFDCACRPGFQYNYEPNYEPLPALSCAECAPGLYQDEFNQSACKPCRANTYNPISGANASLLCLDCPLHSSSPSQSISLTDCVCGLGYAGEPGNECIPCARGEYLDDLTIYECKKCPRDTFNELLAQSLLASCLACGANKSSVAGSGAELNCVCDPGFEYERDTNRYNCSECDVGKFGPNANLSSCLLCERGKFNNDLARTVCVQCADGKFADDKGSTECQPCGFGEYQIIDNFFSIGQTVEQRANTSFLDIKANKCTKCPQFSSHVLTGSTTINECLCVPGYQAQYHLLEGYVFLSHCKLCEPGSFCVGGGQGQGQELCPLNHFSQAGAAVCTRCHPHSFGFQIVNFTECLCLAGFEGPFHDQCTPCLAGSVQPTNFSNVPCSLCPRDFFQPLTGQLTCTQCPPHSTTLSTGSVHITACECDAGFFGPNGGPCEVCPANHYCEGGTVAKDCPAFTQSNNGSSSISDCFCIPGFTAQTNGVQCQHCPANSFCPGGTAQVPCSKHSHSAVGSSSISACICDPGLWRGCIQLANGTQLNHGGVCAINYTLPCFECGADVVCINNTLLHCPLFSTSATGSTHPSDCICNDGYYAEPLNHIH